MEKQCTKCKLTKTISDFYYRKDRETYRSYCIDCHINYTRQQRYNICNKTYLTKLSEQGNACTICSKDLTEYDSKQIHIDHCHVSGMFRGILCHHCNTGLGLFRDNSLLLQQAIRYLEETKTDKKI